MGFLLTNMANLIIGERGFDCHLGRANIGEGKGKSFERDVRKV
jgi:hypothetical protein